MKTRAFTPNFYLANKDMLFSITTKTTIGRNAGDIVLEEDEMLSSVHCEIVPRLLEVFIKDLNSTNGTFVNKQKIFPATEVKLSVGDKVKIGSSEYTVFDNIKEAKKLRPPSERRKHPRPDNLYGPINFVNFYSAARPFQILYVTVLFLTFVSFAVNIKLDVLLPKELEFISKLYSDQILLTGLRTFFFVYLVSLLHSFLMTIYLNRNPLRKIFGLALYAGAIFMLADFAYGPLGGIKLYAVERQNIQEIKPNERAIVHLKNLTDHKKNFTRGYKSIKKLVHAEEEKVLSKDYESMLVKIDSEIGKLDKLLK